MTDTNIEVLHQVTCIAREYRDGILDDTLMVREMTAALSARASAGEGVPEGMREEWFMCCHPAWPDPLPCYGGREDAIATLKRNPNPNAWLLRELTGGRVEYRGDALRDLLAAAPQPAQAGASGGGDGAGVPFCPCCGAHPDAVSKWKRLSFGRFEGLASFDVGGKTLRLLYDEARIVDDILARVIADFTTPASPATEDGPDSFDCPHAHAARVCGCGFCRALNSDRYAFGAPQPAAPQPQTCDCGAKPSTDADQARHSADCGIYPPAHGDGEGE